MKTANLAFYLICCALVLLPSALSAQTSVLSPHQPRSSELTTMAANGSAYYLNRANHSGTQLLATISNAGALAALNTVSMAQMNSSAYSTGGNWTSDAGKLVQFQSNGDITATNTLTVVATTGTWKPSGQLQPDIILFQNVGGVFGRFYSLTLPAVSGSNVVSLPNASGTLARLEDITPARLTQSGATSGQSLVWNGSSWAPGTIGDISWNNDTFVVRDSAAVIQLGLDVNGNAVDQTIKAADGITGTDRNGGDFTVASGNATGTGTSAVVFKTPAAGATGTATRAAAERLRIDSNGLWIENTTAPSANPAAGAVIVYVDPADNRLKARDSSGGVTSLAPSDILPVSLAYGATLTPTISGGLYRTVAMTGDATLNAPSGTPVDGMRWRGRFTADASPRDLTLNAAIKIPSASTFTGTKTIAAGEMWIVQLEYSADLSAWILQSLVGGWH